MISGLLDRMDSYYLCRILKRHSRMFSISIWELRMIYPILVEVRGYCPKLNPQVTESFNWCIRVMKIMNNGNQDI